MFFILGSEISFGLTYFSFSSRNLTWSIKVTSVKGNLTVSKVTFRTKYFLCEIILYTTRFLHKLCSSLLNRNLHPDPLLKKGIWNLKRENFKKRKSKENLLITQGSFSAVFLKINDDFSKTLAVGWERVNKTRF